MYYSNVVVDGVVTKLPEIFNFTQADEKEFSKITKSDDALSDTPFPVETVFWPEDAPLGRIDSFRGTGATAIVHGGGDGLVVQLNTGVMYESFMERKYMQGSMPVTKVTDSVLDMLSSRTLWANVEDGVSGPMLGNFDSAQNEAAMADMVAKGEHVMGVAARLVVLAIEHALTPFTQRTRVRNAAACYWCTGKYRSDAIVYSLQNTQALLSWAAPGGIGKENDPTAVVWVGPADKRRGMALLSRLMDRGGPIQGQRSYLLDQFDSGRLLMAGTGALSRDLVPVQASDLEDAIDEAMWVLVTYNNLPPTFIRNALRLVCRNLPILDLAHFREHVTRYWRTATGTLGDPDLNIVMQDLLNQLAGRYFTDEGLESVGLDDEELKRGVLSDLFRHQLMRPVGGVDGLAPSTVHTVDWRILGILGALQTPQHGAVGGISVHTAEFDAALPPAMPRMAAVTRQMMDDVMPCFSGRAGYHLYGYSNPLPAGGGVPVIPDGWQVCAVQPLDLPLPRGVAPDGVWLEWVGGNNPAGDAHLVVVGLRSYVVRMWLPSTSDQYMNGYTLPTARLKRFDVKADMQLGVRLNGAWPDLSEQCPRVHDYVRGAVTGRDPLDYLDEEGQRTMNGLTMTQKSVALMIGIAYCWDAFAGAGQQNDAYKRWARVHHRDRHLTTVPDELKLYLGGVRSRKYLEACGGLWTLCFQKHVKLVRARAGHEEIMYVTRDRSMFAMYLLKLRCAIEMSDQLMRMSNSRITGCRDPFLWPNVVDDRLNRARIDELTIIDGATYLARQALFLAAVFDHPDSTVARTFGVTACSTMRLREPVAMHLGFDVEEVKHMNWLSPQTLRYGAWSWFYGVAAPTYVPDRKARGWLYDARYTTRWQHVADEFVAGGMIDKEDEVWSAILTGMVGTDWYPASLEIAQFGTKLLVDTSFVRAYHANGYTQPLLRLNLPYETRLGVATVYGGGHDTNIRPFLPCRDVATHWNDGDQLPWTEIVYDGRGKVESITFDPRNVVGGAENIDVRDTTFASDGVQIGTYAPAIIVGAFVNVERNVGQFWMHITRVEEGVTAGMSNSGQRLMHFLTPPPAVAVSDDGGDDGVQAMNRLEKDVADVAAVANPGESGVGDLPLHEIIAGQDAASIISSLSGLSQEMQELIRTALLKDKPMPNTSSDRTETTDMSTDAGSGS